MATQQGSINLLQDEVAQKLLHSTNMACLGYNWTDGTPRVTPIWFHWNGQQVVMGSPPGAPKLHALKSGDRVAVTIEDHNWPYKVLYLRGTIALETVDGIVPEYILAAERYMGAENAKGWVDQVKGMYTQMYRLSFTPDWAGIIDMETRFPSALEAAMAG